MRKYKAGDKIVLDVLSSDGDGWYKIGGEYYSWWENPNYLDKVSEPLIEYTEKLEKKNQNKQKRIEKLVERLHRQADEITRLLKDNYELALKVCEDDAKARTAGQEEAWKLATKIALDEMFGGYKVSELEVIFGSMHLEDIFHQSYPEAAAKVAEWERKTEEICVGDVVKAKDRECVEFCVTEIDDKGAIYGISSKGCVYSGRSTDNWEKTGRHIDVDAWLAQIGGGSNE